MCEEDTGLLAGRMEIAFESFNLRDVFADQRLFSEHLVELGFVANILCACSVVKCGDCFFEVGFGGRYGCNDASFSTPTEGVLEETGEFGLPTEG